MARPNPCAPPVTTAQRPSRSILFMLNAFACLSEHEAAVDDHVDTGGEGGFVTRKIHRHGCDLLGGAGPAAAARSSIEGVSTVPGQIALQRMPWVMKSSATARVSSETAAFDAL